MNHDANSIVQAVILVILVAVSLLPLFLVVTFGAAFLFDRVFPERRNISKRKWKPRIIVGGKKEKKK